MKTSTLLTTMLAGASVCALSAVPALAAPPNIHAFGMPRLGSGVVHFKTNMTGCTVHNSNCTSTVTLSGTISSYFDGLLYSSEHYQTTSSGNCVRPKRVKWTYSKPMNGKVREVEKKVPCPTGGTGYALKVGPHYKVTNHNATSDSFTGRSSINCEPYARKCVLKENVYLRID
ncbi:MAG TPA: hypothetical protein VMF67_05610 [Rhizomicrobium sp.]|nr:hypothetical protein [Rhizomicrobium sp.]